MIDDNVYEVGAYTVDRFVTLKLDSYDIHYTDNRIPDDDIHTYKRVILSGIELNFGRCGEHSSAVDITRELERRGYHVHGCEYTHSGNVLINIPSKAGDLIERWMKQDAESEKPREVPAELKPKERTDFPPEYDELLPFN